MGWRFAPFALEGGAAKRRGLCAGVVKKRRIKSIKLTDYKAAIFDLDGTLLDSMPIWESVAADYLKTRGITPKANINEELIALGGHEIPEYFQTEYGLRETAEAIHRGMYELLEAFYFYKAPLKNGVAAVLSTLRENGVKMCVATATDRWLVEPALERCGILEYFARIFTCGEEETSKSSPDIYIRAADFLGAEITDTLVFEDALYAMKSAKRAGFPVAAVYDRSARDKQDEIKAVSDYYFVSMDEMLG